VTEKPGSFPLSVLADAKRTLCEALAMDGALSVKSNNFGTAIAAIVD
jgi:hypothetical protein